MYSKVKRSGSKLVTVIFDFKLVNRNVNFYKSNVYSNLKNYQNA